ncbi:MAG: 2-amino-4-hydroxy-6-hydroxymethyldihydropteridine diphosphokinase [Peptococcia bacterium]
MSSKEIYLSLGSNQGDSLEYLLQGILALAENEIEIDRVSSIYKTEPVGFTAQDDFLNMVIQATTALEPLELLHCCQEIEKGLHRIRTQRWGPRTLDIDILFIGQEKICLPELTVPHPRLTERAFVLVPLQEIAPKLFQSLRVTIPTQKISLLIDKPDVKMMLEKRGLNLTKPC